MSLEKRNKAVVLLSAGLDSSVNLAFAVKYHQVPLCLTFDYGQIAAQKEIQAAKNLCHHHSVPHLVVDLKWFNDFSSSALNSKQLLPVDRFVSIDDHETSKTSASSVWVPNRNGIFLNIAAGYAEGLKADWVIPGFNREEAMTFPDNSDQFIEALNASFKYSTGDRVKVQCFTSALDKTEIVKLGIDLKVDFKMMWPCYQNQMKWCGSCESCQRFKRALRANGLNFEELS